MVDMRQGALPGGSHGFQQAGVDRYQGMWNQALGYKGGQQMQSLRQETQVSGIDPEEVATAVRSGYNTPQSLAQLFGISTTEATRLLQTVNTGQRAINVGQRGAPVPDAAAPIQRMSVPSFNPQQGGR